MATDNFLTSRREERLPLLHFIMQRHELLHQDPARTLSPLILCLAEIHRNGQAHGAVSGERLLFYPSGTLDLPFFQANTSALTQTEQLCYYPHGQGDSLAERQQRDVEALAAVLHFAMTGAMPPTPPFRSAQSLAGHTVLGAWPESFIAVVRRLLAPVEGSAQPTLMDLFQALQETTPASPAAPASTALEPPELPPLEATNLPAPAAAAPEVSEATEAQPEAAVPEPAEAPAPEPAPPQPVAPVAAQPPVLPATPIRLPNVTAGRVIAIELLPLVSAGAMTFAKVEATGELPSGLAITGSILSGTATSSGEHEIDITCIIDSADSGRPSALARKLALTINPDPSSLWKNIASDQGLPFWKQDNAIESLPDSPAMVAAASRRGRSHAHVGSCRDDDFSLSWYPGSGWYCLNVADGAGSAKFSRQGSLIACQQVGMHFANLFEGPTAGALTRRVEAWAATAGAHGNEEHRDIINALYQEFGTAALGARKEIEKQAAASNALLKDFHTTLITTLVRPLAEGAWFIAGFSIGDGAAAAVGVPETSPCLFSRPDGGEFAGQTVFLTMKESLASGQAIMERIRCAIVPSLEALVLVTDGVSDPCFDSETALAEHGAWQQLWAQVSPLIASSSTRDEAAQRLLDWMAFPSTGHHDDRTIAVLCPALGPSATSAP